MSGAADSHVMTDTILSPRKTICFDSLNEK